MHGKVSLKQYLASFAGWIDRKHRLVGYPKLSSSVFAARRSAVSKPSVKRP